MKLGDSAAGSAATIIACILAAETGQPGSRAALYRRAASLVSRACRTGPWEGLRELAVYARNDALAAGTPPEVRRGALALLSALEQPATAHALVSATVDAGALTPEFEALLAAPGGSTIWAIAQRLATPGTPARVLEGLRSFAVRLGADAWRRAAEMSGAIPEQAVAAAAPLAAALPRRLAREVLEKLAQHPSPVARSHAAAHLAALRPEPAATEAGA